MKDFQKFRGQLITEGITQNVLCVCIHLRSAAGIPLIFVNPDWNSRKSNSEVVIKCDGEHVFGWFSEDAVAPS